jgi:hypothetical protein
MRQNNFPGINKKAHQHWVFHAVGNGIMPEGYFPLLDGNVLLRIALPDFIGQIVPSLHAVFEPVIMNNVS